MISSILVNNIYDLVNRIGVIYREQVFRMFKAQHGEETIDWCINSLLNNCQIDYDTETDTLKRRQMLCETDFGQKLLTQAAWVLASMGEAEVRDYLAVKYPSQILIIGENNQVYDVTVITYQTFDALAMSILSYRKQLLPDGMEDNIIHIAVLPDKKMADKVKALPFDSYCIIKNNEPVYYEF